MALSILTNVPAITVRRHLEAGATNYAKSMERLASGKRINRPGDDAAGLSLAYGLEARIRSIHQAKRNAEDALSLIQVAGGGLNEVGNILTRLRELAIQSASDTIGDHEREMLQIEASQLQQEIDRIAGSTKYLGTQLLNGEGRSFDFWVGIDADEHALLSYDTSKIDIRSDTLGVDDIDITDKDSARDVFEAVDQAVKKLSFPMSTIGAMQTRINIAINHLDNYGENLQAAKSRVLDADLAKEATEMVRGQIQQKAAIAVLSQANMIPTMALRLIEGY